MTTQEFTGRCFTCERDVYAKRVLEMKLGTRVYTICIGCVLSMCSALMESTHDTEAVEWPHEPLVEAQQAPITRRPQVPQGPHSHVHRCGHVWEHTTVRGCLEPSRYTFDCVVCDPSGHTGDA